MPNVFPAHPHFDPRDSTSLVLNVPQFTPPYRTDTRFPPDPPPASPAASNPWMYSFPPPPSTPTPTLDDYSQSHFIDPHRIGHVFPSPSPQFQPQPYPTNPAFHTHTHPHPSYPAQLPLPTLAQPAFALSSTPPETGLPRCALAGSLDPTTGIFYRTPEHPRLRTAQACEKCRIRKAKCSGDHPTCQRCHVRGLVCVYAPEGRIRGPNKPKPKPSSSAIKSTPPSSTKSSINSPSPTSTPPRSLPSTTDNDSEHEEGRVTRSQSASRRHASVKKGKAGARARGRTSSRGRHTRPAKIGTSPAPQEPPSSSPSEPTFAAEGDAPPVRRGPGRPRKIRLAPRTLSTETTKASRQDKGIATDPRLEDEDAADPRADDDNGTSIKMDLDDESLLSEPLDMDTAPTRVNDVANAKIKPQPPRLIFLDPLTTPKAPADRQPVHMTSSFPTIFQYVDSHAISASLVEVSGGTSDDSGSTIGSGSSRGSSFTSTPSTSTSSSCSPIATRANSSGPPTTPDNNFPIPLSSRGYTYPSPFMLGSASSSSAGGGGDGMRYSPSPTSSSASSPLPLPLSSLLSHHGHVDGHGVGVGVDVVNGDEYDGLGLGFDVGGGGFGYIGNNGYGSSFGCGEYGTGAYVGNSGRGGTTTPYLEMGLGSGLDLDLGMDLGFGVEGEGEGEMDVGVGIGTGDAVEVHARGTGFVGGGGGDGGCATQMSEFVEWPPREGKKEEEVQESRVQDIDEVREEGTVGAGQQASSEV